MAASTPNRAPAITLNAGRQDEDSQIVLLRDIRDVFDGWHVDRIASADLVDALGLAHRTGGHLILIGIK
jgi:hypothetical protein